MIRVLPVGMLLLTMMAFRCENRDPCFNESRSFLFSASGEFVPATADVRAGDTVRYVASLPKTLFDSISRQPVDASNARISGWLALYRVDTVQKQFRSDSLFLRFVALTGSVSTQGGNRTEYTYLEEPQQYRVEVGVVPDRPGIYALQLDDLQARGFQGRQCDLGTFWWHAAPPPASIALFQQVFGPQYATRPEFVYCFRVR